MKASKGTNKHQKKEKKKDKPVYIPYFDPNLIGDSQGVAVFGPRNSGKTTFAKDIISVIGKRYDTGICINLTEGVNHAWSNHIPSMFLKYNADPMHISEMFSHQKKILNESNLAGPGREKGVFLIMDDCLVDRAFINSKALWELLITGRHYRITFMITAQYLKKIHPSLRQNFDWIVIVPTASVEEKKQAEEMIADSSGMSNETFDEIYESVKRVRGALVFHQISNSLDEPSLFWYKPNPDIAFRLCKPIFWELSNRFGNKIEDKGVEQYSAIKELFDFNTSSIKYGDTIMIVGMKDSGKSTLAANILKRFNHMKYGVVVSTTELLNGFWSKHIPKCQIFSDTDIGVVTNLRRTQERLSKGMKDSYPCFLILDDCMSDHSFVRNHEIEKMILTGRHYNITVIIITQYLMSVPKAMRKNFDWIMVIPSPMAPDEITSYKEFGNCVGTKEEFHNVYETCRKERSSMIFHQSAKEDRNEIVKKFSCDPYVEFKLCDKVFWSYAETPSGLLKKNNLIRNVNMIYLERMKTFPGGDEAYKKKYHVANKKGKANEKFGKAVYFRRPKQRFLLGSKVYEDIFFKKV